MNVDDYIYVYFKVIEKAAELCPTTDREVVSNISDERFYEIVQKLGQEKMTQQLRNMFIELVKEGVFRGTLAKQLIIIQSVTPVGYSVLEESKSESFWSKVKKAAPKWAVNSLTSFLISYLTR